MLRLETQPLSFKRVTQKKIKPLVTFSIIIFDLFFKNYSKNKYLLNIYCVAVAVLGKRDGSLSKREIHLDLV